MGAAGGPAEPEEADGDAEAAEDCGRETQFGFQVAIGVKLRFCVFVEVPVVGELNETWIGRSERWMEGGDLPPEWRKHKKSPKQNSYESHALLANREMVVFHENDRKRFEPEIDQGVKKRNVKVERQYDRLKERQRERANENH